jgi:hypothetical protein
MKHISFKAIRKNFAAYFDATEAKHQGSGFKVFVLHVSLHCIPFPDFVGAGKGRQRSFFRDPATACLRQQPPRQFPGPAQALPKTTNAHEVIAPQFV